MTTHQFGGQWTERKLAALREYLAQYQLIFHKNPVAKTYRTVYVDAFAGTGGRESKQQPDDTTPFFYGEETRAYQQGSVQVVLSLDRKFHRYVFIDSKSAHIQSVRALIDSRFAEIAYRCDTVNEDANTWLTQWCSDQDWRKQRAVVFLDPYGMSVSWRTIEAIARTKAIDLWVLFPFAIGANRMMPKAGLPETDWGRKLTDVFGTANWVSNFYRKNTSTDLFGETSNSVSKTVGPDEILEFFLSRLREVFPHVVDRPLILYNSNRSPMYALCFAAGNPRGGKTALKIAEYLTRTK